MEIAEECKVRRAAGECFVHVEKKFSSNKNLNLLSQLTKGAKSHKVKLWGSDAESILTNSAHVARMIKKADCESSEAVETKLEKDAKGNHWEEDKKGFEHYMLGEDEVRMEWTPGR